MHNFPCNWCHLPFNSCHTKLTEWVEQEAGGVAAWWHAAQEGLARLGERTVGGCSQLCEAKRDDMELS